MVTYTTAAVKGNVHHIWVTRNGGAHGSLPLVGATSRKAVPARSERRAAPAATLSRWTPSENTTLHAESRAIARCPHGARTVPAQCPHSAPCENVGFSESRIGKEPDSPFLNRGISISLCFYRGHCAGTVRALCGHCAGTVRAPYGGTVRAPPFHVTQMWCTLPFTSAVVCVTF